MSTIKVTNINPPTAGQAVNLNGLAYPTAGPLSNRNLIINGAMQVAQRGTSTTGVGTEIAYNTVDRWRFADASDPSARYTETQSTDAPEGFSNSRKFEVTTADTNVEADEDQYTDHFIEAQNLQHLAYGTSNAKKITLSFWVKSSVAQTFGCGLIHQDGGGNYGVSYTVNSADTWEYKTLTFNGNTSTAINNDNGRGLQIKFGLAAGSDQIAGSDATAWGGTETYGQHSNTWVGTVGNTWQITGVQLEVGSVATPFGHRSYGDELARCQRYYQRIQSTSTSDPVGIGYCEGSTEAKCMTDFKVTMRTSPTALETSGTAGDYEIRNKANYTCNVVPVINKATADCMTIQFNVSSGLTDGDACQMRFVDTDGFLAWSAEL